MVQSRFIKNIAKSVLQTADPTGMYKAIESGLKARKALREKAPNIAKLADKVGEAIVAAPYSLVDTAEQVAVPLVKGEGVKGIDLLGKDRSITEIPKAKKFLSDAFKTQLKAITPPIVSLATTPMVDKIPEDITAELGRQGAKMSAATLIGLSPTLIKSVKNWYSKLPAVEKKAMGKLSPEEIYNKYIQKEKTSLSQVMKKLPENKRKDVFSYLRKITGAQEPVPTTTVKPPKVKPIIPQEQLPVPTALAPTEPQINPVQKVTNLLKKANPIRGKQEQLYKTERGKRLKAITKVGKAVPGEKGYYAKLSKLKGELPKADFDAIRQNLKQDDIDYLYNEVQKSPALSEWDKLNASKGLTKLFGQMGTSVPTRSEIKLLSQVFPDEMISTLLDMRPFQEKLGRALVEVVNIPRALLASFDLSAPFRQGAVLVSSPEFWSSYKKMFNVAFNEQNYQDLMTEIQNDPLYESAMDSGLSITKLGSILEDREEAYMSNYAEKIPILGKGVRASERAYVGFLDKLRFDTYKNLVDRAEKAGLDPLNNADLTKSLATFINAATGRGKLPSSLERASVTANAVFFSPKFITSRINLLNPVFYAKLNPFVRKQALKSMLNFASIYLTIAGLASAAGAKVNKDIRNADFGKIRIGNTRIDVLAGFLPVIRLVGQLIKGEIVSSTSGKVMKLGDKEAFRPLTRKDILLRFWEYKLSPVASFVRDMLENQTAIGEDLTLKNQIVDRVTPMVIQDMIDLYKEDPKLVPLGALGVFGVGIQTYGNKKKPSKKYRAPIGDNRSRFLRAVNK